MSKDPFAHKASSYEQDKDRVDNVANIASAMLGRIQFAKSMHIMDFGSGTGLLLERIAPHVGRITAVDVSPSMSAQLRDKQSRIACSLEILEMDLATETPAHRFDGIISSMTMHHINDIPSMLRKFHALLKDGGFVAIADLDREDGSFHHEETGVHHHGFDRVTTAKLASDAGFKNIATVTASMIRKVQGAYPVFLLTGIR